MNDGAESRYELLAAQTLSRRGFVAGSAALVAAAGRGRFGASDAGAATEAGELSYYNWASYVNPKTYAAFTKATGIEVAKDYYVSNEALLARLESGTRRYDLAVPTGYTVRLLAQEKLLHPIDWSKLPAVRRNIDRRFRKLPFDPKDRHSVAKDWGTTGFMYRSDLVKERPKTWKAFVALAKGEHSGKVTVLDGIDECIGAMLVMLGYSYNSDDESELDQAKKELIALKPHLLSVTSTEYRQLLIKGKAVMALGWNGDALTAAAEKPVTYVVAKEGGEFWVDSYVIPVGAKNSDAAHRWIDFVYTPRISALETSYTYYASPLQRARLRGVLAPSILTNQTVFPAPSVVARLQPNAVTPKGTALRNSIWMEFRDA